MILNSTSTPAAVVTLDEVKTYLKIPLTNTHVNDELTALIDPATEAVKQHLNRSLSQETWQYQPRLNLSYIKPELALNLPKPPIVSIQTVNLYNQENIATAITADHYLLVGNTFFLKKVPSDVFNLRKIYPLEILFTAGYSSIPSPIKLSILGLIENLYECSISVNNLHNLPTSVVSLLHRYEIDAGYFSLNY